VASRLGPQYNRSIRFDSQRKVIAVARSSPAWLLLPAFALVGLAAVPAPAPAREAESLKSQLDEVIDGPEYKHASWGVLVVDGKTGETVYSRNPDAMLAPASVTKLFTCAAALIALGPDKTFDTVVYQRGPVFKNTLRGDLILVAGGDVTLGGRTDKNGHIAFTNNDHTYANSGLNDPELTDTDPLAGLNALAKQVKDAGITRIDGDVLIDDRLFLRTMSTGSGPEAVSPIMVNDNLVDVIIEAGKNPGDPATVTTRPESAYFQMDALVTTTDRNDDVRGPRRDSARQEDDSHRADQRPGVIRAGLVHRGPASERRASRRADCETNDSRSARAGVVRRGPQGRHVHLAAVQGNNQGDVKG